MPQILSLGGTDTVPETLPPIAKVNTINDM